MIHTPRVHNAKANSLAKLALVLNSKLNITILIEYLDAPYYPYDN